LALTSPRKIKGSVVKCSGNVLILSIDPLNWKEVLEAENFPVAFPLKSILGSFTSAYTVNAER
jgi:hypothetical protein